mgnify:CR=1 FL=1
MVRNQSSEKNSLEGSKCFKVPVFRPENGDFEFEYEIYATGVSEYIFVVIIVSGWPYELILKSIGLYDAYPLYGGLKANPVF